MRQLRLRWLRAGALGASLAVPAFAEAQTLELRPAVAGGFASIVESHSSFSAALRVQFQGLFVQPEYLALGAQDHTDHGFAVMVGLSTRARERVRGYVGIGAGPIKGYRGDDGIRFLALGTAFPIAKRGTVFGQLELRAGILGESGYSQIALSIGLSR